MPGIVGTPFFGQQLIWDEQPPVAAVISTDTVQAIPDTAFTALTFASPINIDPLALRAWRSLWTSGTPGQFTIGLRGLYLAGCSLYLAPATYTRGEVAIVLNGVLQAVQGADSAGATRAYAVSSLLPLVAGDVVTCAVFQNSGGPVDTVVSGLVPTMWITRVG